MKQRIWISVASSGTVLWLAGALAAAEPATVAADAAAPQTVKATFLITGLHCPPCTSTVEKSIKSIKGVRTVKVESSVIP